MLCKRGGTCHFIITMVPSYLGCSILEPQMDSWIQVTLGIFPWGRKDINQIKNTAKCTSLQPGSSWVRGHGYLPPVLLDLKWPFLAKKVTTGFQPKIKSEFLKIPIKGFRRARENQESWDVWWQGPPVFTNMWNRGDENLQMHPNK